MASSGESELATYVLAYLLQNNFKTSANAFLHECDVLPSKSFIVLPETSLSSIVAEHKTRLNAKVLVNTLGSEQAWQELWAKLQTTLSQIKCLSEDLNSCQFQPVSRKRAIPKLAGEHVKSTTPKTGSLTPHKRKQSSCKRIQTLSPPSTPPQPVTEPDPPNSPTIQHVLDTFLDTSFPEKLADIINQCVSSDVGPDISVSSGMSSETLERILNATLSESTLEPSGLNTTTTISSTTVAPQNGDSSSLNKFSAAHKKAKLEVDTQGFPSEQDIDTFLDQIHQ